MNKPHIGLILSCLIFIAATGLHGCATISGIGQDISAAGEVVDKQARKRKPY